MLKLAVVGKDVSASRSPQMHEFILRRMGSGCSYEKISLSPAEFSGYAEELFSRFDGFNVTIPFKRDILPFLNGIEGDAAKFGAVNTVFCEERLGYNTDGYGFMLMLEGAEIAVKRESVLVLGAGGAGRSCVRKLRDAGAEVFVFERDAARLKTVLQEIGGFTPLDEVPLRKFGLIVNCTGIGMHDTEGKTPEIVTEKGVRVPVGEELLSLAGAAADLIYEPAESEFLRIAREAGKKTVNGESMLFYQAYRADCIWLGREPSADEAKQLYRAYREEA